MSNICKAKVKGENKWVRGYYQKRYNKAEEPEHLIFSASSFSVWKYVEIDVETLCESSGFKDVNEGEIFEHDIVKHIGTSKKMEVVFDKNRGAWILTRDGEYVGPLRESNGPNVKIIGNIHDVDTKSIKKD